ncbi:MAG: sensor histidine kinase [Gemmatimonas sp.]
MRKQGATMPGVVERIRSTSLERRLPLMISGLLVLTITAFGFIAFSEVRSSSKAAANGQLRTIIMQTGDVAGRTLTTRAETLGALRRNPVFTQAVSATASPEQKELAATTLRSKRTPADTLTFGAQVMVGASGQRTQIDGINLTDKDREMLDQTLRTASTSATGVIGLPYAKDSTMWYWTATAVSPGDEPLGFVAELRRLRANPNIDQQLKGFTGQDISMYYAAEGANVWTGLRGVPIVPKFDLKATPDSFHVRTKAGESLIGVKQRMNDTDWFIMFTINEAAVNARSMAFLQRMMGVAIILLGVAIAAAWWVSRRVTKPLKSLTVAARTVAAGDYSPREPVQTNDELGELSRTFNMMAERIGESHAQLGMRIEESEALARQLHKASIAKSEFLAMMSHELRTPLSAIAGYAEILQSGMRGELNDAQQSDLRRIQANQVHLLRIINDILDLTQVESGQMQITLQSVTLRDVMNDLEPIVAPLVSERGIKFSVRETVHSMTVMAERDRLTQVLVNLVANAIRFTPADGSVTIHATPRGSSVQLHVTDTGIGIPDDKHEAIFQPFVQAESGASRRAQGTGLGLAISRRIVEAMNGTLVVKSSPGNGSTFTLTLHAVTTTPDAEWAGVHKSFPDGVSLAPPSRETQHAGT